MDSTIITKKIIETDELQDLDLGAGSAVTPSVNSRPGKSETVSDLDLAAAAVRIHKLLDGMKAGAVKVGRELIAIKAKLQHGEFGKWIATEFHMSDRTAQNCMNAATVIEGNQTLAALPDKALYLLGAKSTPPEIIELVAAKVLEGKMPTAREIKEHVQAARKEAAKLAVKTRGLSPEDAEKKIKKIKEGKKKRDAARKAKADANQLEWHRKQEEAKANGQEAVAFLKEHLGSRFVEFVDLYKLGGSFPFDHALRHGERSNA